MQSLAARPRLARALSRGDEPAGMESQDPVVALYRKHLDRSLLQENLKRTPTERIQRLMDMQVLAEEMRKARQKAKKK